MATYPSDNIYPAVKIVDCPTIVQAQEALSNPSAYIVLATDAAHTIGHEWFVQTINEEQGWYSYKIGKDGTSTKSQLNTLDTYEDKGEVLYGWEIWQKRKEENYLLLTRGDGHFDYAFYRTDRSAESVFKSAMKQGYLKDVILSSYNKGNTDKSRENIIENGTRVILPFSQIHYIESNHVKILTRQF